MQERRKVKAVLKKDLPFQKNLIRKWKIIGARKNKLDGVV